jgi:hypothetical protein
MKTQSRFGVTIAATGGGGGDTHVPVTVTDSNTIDFTASGTNLQTITGEVKISATAGNAITENIDGIYAAVGSGDGGGYLSVTYNELSNLISGGDLIPGKKYLITDYQTVHFIPGTAAINTGPIEPLIVTALTITDLEPVAYSTLHKDDIIYYSPVNGSSYCPGSTKGFIYRRIDTVLNNDISTDFRYVKYRRYKITEDTWNSATSYTKWDIVKSTTDNSLYVSTKDVNLNNAVTDDASWAVLPFEDQAYVGIFPTTWTIGDVTFTTSSEDFQDYFLFNEIIFAPTVYNNTIISRSLMNTVFLNANNSNNNIIYDISDTTFLGGSSHSTFDDSTNNVIAGSGDNTIHSNFTDNIISSNFFANTIGEYFSNNIIGDGFQYNIIGAGFNFNSNIIGGSFFKNHIYYIFHDNEIAAGFSNNKIHSTFDNNRILDFFSSNLINTGISLTDFTASTYVYANYGSSKEILARPNNTIILKYIDNSNAFVFVNYDA